MQISISITVSTRNLFNGCIANLWRKDGLTTVDALHDVFVVPAVFNKMTRLIRNALIMAVPKLEVHGRPGV
jgi:hypothetical protein